MSAFESAIDDSFEPNPLLQPEKDEDADNAFDEAYNGPREGQWDVSSSVGSFIDDRCPTLYAYRAWPVPGGHAQGIAGDGGLAKRLMEATIEEKRVAAIKHTTKAVSAHSEAQPSSATPIEKKPKPFIVPSLTPRAARTAVQAYHEPKKAAKSQPLRSTNVEVKTKEPTRTSRQAKKATTQIPDAQTTTTDPAKPSSRKIRILGRNGEEAFIELPSPSVLLQPSSPSVSRPGQRPSSIMPQPVQEKAIINKKPIRPKAEGNNEVKQAKGNAEKQKSAPKKSPPAQTNAPQVNVSEQNDAVMSGALPASSRHLSLARQSMAGSCKDSGIAMDGTFDAAKRPGSEISQRALSVAQSIANMSVAGDKRPSSKSGMPTLQVSEQVGVGRTTGFPVPNRMSERSIRAAATTQQWASRQNSPTSKKSRNTEEKRRDEEGTQRTAPGNYKPPTVESASSSTSVALSFGGFVRNDNRVQPQDGPSEAQRSRLSSRQTQSEHSKANSGNASASWMAQGVSQAASSRQGRSDVRRESPVGPASKRNNARSKSELQNQWPASPQRPSSRYCNDFQQQTNFAGDGWISPHPLSVASSDWRPSAAVQVSTPGSGQGRTLTYEEWRAQRDQARSISGSFVGSHVPTAIGSQAVVPLTAYNHPPPAGYVGSYREVAQRRQQAQWPSVHSGAWPSYQQDDNWDPPANPSLRQWNWDTQNTQGYARTINTASANSGSVYQTPSVLAQNADWNLPPQYDGSGSEPRGAYNVGLTPRELEAYQRQLGSTISRYSSQLHHVQQERAPPQPDYSVWNSRESHVSARGPSYQSAPSSQSHPRLKTQIMMPWDQAPNHVSHSTKQSDHLGLLNIRGPWGRYGPSARAPAPLAPSIHRSTYSANQSGVSQSVARAPQSEVSYGTMEWQNLENAEQGQGGFQPYRTW